MKTIELNNGIQVPVMGFGTYQSNESEGIEAISFAIKNGYRLIDTAAFYHNEEIIGKGIKASGVPREELFVTTKLWRDSLGYENAIYELNRSLERLDLDYIDLYLIHWPANQLNYENWKKVNADTWRALEHLQAEGKIKSIGVSNFWEEQLKALLETARVIPAVNQIEFHPGFWQPELLELCHKNNIAVEGWSPLARGTVFQEETLQEIASNHNKSVAQVCLRWAIQHDVIPIPKSTTNNRILENLEVFDFELSADEMYKVDHLPEMGFSRESPYTWPIKVRELSETLY